MTKSEIAECTTSETREIKPHTCSPNVVEHQEDVQQTDFVKFLLLNEVANRLRETALCKVCTNPGDGEQHYRDQKGLANCEAVMREHCINLRIKQLDKYPIGFKHQADPSLTVGSLHLTETFLFIDQSSMCHLTCLPGTLPPLCFLPIFIPFT